MNNSQENAENIGSTYLDTNTACSGVLLLATANLRKYFSESFLFMMKCAFELKVANTLDENTMIIQAELAITTKNMKSIQYPYTSYLYFFSLEEVSFVSCFAFSSCFSSFKSSIGIGSTVCSILNLSNRLSFSVGYCSG